MELKLLVYISYATRYKFDQYLLDKYIILAIIQLTEAETI